MSFARVRGPGQPDQACDLVAAAVAEEYLRRDPTACLNVRVSGGRGVLFVAGDVRSSADFDVAAVVRRSLGLSGVTSPVEPFIAFEPMAPSWAAGYGARTPLSVSGYATAETEDAFPSAMSVARDVARELERRRTSDPEWFWLGSDYEVTAERRQPKPLIVVRVEHGTKALEEIRGQVAAVIGARHPAWEVRVNVAGEEGSSGLEHRMGSSGQASSSEFYGTGLPANPSGAGFQLTHPANAGAWLVRHAARELLAQGKGQAIMVQAIWLPTDAIPSSLRIRNERGENLSALLAASRFDLSKLSDEWRAARLLSASVRSPYEGGSVLPWEN